MTAPVKTTKTNRVNYAEQSPDLFKKLMDFSDAAKKSAIEHTVQYLVEIRASQINGCAFCLDMHVKQAKIHGERELRLHHVAIWRESPLFNPRERAALEWTETLTKLPEHGVCSEVFDRVRQQFSEKEISDLTYIVMIINSWNRANIAFRTEPGIFDHMFGLEKAGLS